VSLSGRELLQRLVPALLGGKVVAGADGAGEVDFGGALEGILVEHVQGLMQERTSSHCLEVRRLAMDLLILRLSEAATALFTTQSVSRRLHGKIC
jgi:hypothetical protein